MPQWSDSYKLGNPIIDGEHKQLFDLLEWLEGKLFREESLNHHELKAMVSQLNSHMEEHFRHEESMMENLQQMPESEKTDHQKDHALWVVRLQEHLNPLMNSKTDLERRGHLARILRVGKAFWEQHFVIFDTKLAHFMVAQN